MNTELVHFHGQQIVTLRQDDGTVYVALKPIVDAMGISWQGQLERIKRDAVLSTCIRVTRMQMPGDSQSREHIFLPLDMLNGWLFGIDANRVKPELRDTVIDHQRECYRVLAAHFHGKALVQNERYWFARRAHWEFIRRLAYEGYPCRAIAQRFNPPRSAASVRNCVKAMVARGLINPETLAARQQGPARQAARRQIPGWGQAQQAFNFDGATA